MPPKAITTVAATGGAIALDITLGINLPILTTPIAIYRNDPILSSTTLIYSGLATPVYLDVGDGLPNYLTFTTPYSYTIVDPSGSFTTSGLAPQGYLTIFSTYIDKVMLRLFSAGINSQTVPAGFKKIRVMQSMPLAMGSEGSIFPFLVMNLDLEQQEQLEIGQAITDDDSINLDIKPIIIFRRYSINICSLNAQERDYYKDVIISTFYGGVLPMLTKMGLDVTINLQAAQSQSSDEGMQPGFYISTIMVEFTGIQNISIDNNFPLIEFINPEITSTAYATSGSSITVNI